jgi:hypothetical protein
MLGQRQRKPPLLALAAATAAAALAAAPAVAAPGNIVPDPGFESCSLAGAAAPDWSGSPVVTCTSTHRSGNWGLQFSNTIFPQISRSTCVNQTLSGSHAASFAYDVTSGANVGAVSSVEFGATFYTGADCTGTSSASVSLSDTSITGGSFELVSGTLTVPPGTWTSVQFAIAVNCSLSSSAGEGGVTCAPYTVVFDDVSFESSALAATFRSATAVPSRGGVLVRWRTAAEVDARGFDVYREQGGRRLRANRQLVAAKGSAGRGAVYSVLDRRAPRSARRYRLEEVKRDRARFVLGDVAVAG